MEQYDKPGLYRDGVYLGTDEPPASKIQAGETQVGVVVLPNLRWMTEQELADHNAYCELAFAQHPD